MIELKGVVKLYDGKAAVECLDLTIRRGSIYGLIGPNGAGKTTSLKMMATLIKPDEGSVRIGDLVLPEQIARARRLIGYMPDRQGNFRGLSAMDYLQYFGRLHEIGRAALRERIGTVLELTDLETVKDELVSTLSLGMRQRLALAKTLLHDPEVLILDEPASGLDPRARIEIRELLKELGRMGKTVVISSHILADLDEICTDVGIIEKGELLASGPLDEIRNQTDSRERRFQVRVPPAEHRRALEALQEVTEVTAASPASEPGDGDLLVKVDGLGKNAILAALLARDIEILAFSEERTSLEDIFMNRTRGALQ